MNEKRITILLSIVVITFGILFELQLPLLCVVVILFAFFIPQLQKNQRLQKEELEKFQDINLYMSQMSQSFVSHKNILSALRETANTFPSGDMLTTIEETIEILLMDGGDISMTERKAFSYLEENYKCEKLRNLHEFLLIAETRGGECKEEFVILEKARIAWETALSDYRQKLIYQRNTCSFLYALMLGVCLFVLHAFPPELCIIQIPFVQITNTTMLMLFILLHFLMDRKINHQLFKTPQTSTNGASKFFLKREVQTAFPKWLFDILLLIQRQSVDSAILQSASSAPAVLQPELSRISSLLLEYPGSIDPYISFLSEYHIPQIETTMRKLYALSSGAGQNADTVHFLMNANMDSLIESERKSYETKGDVSTLFSFFPMLIASLGMLVYCSAIITLTLSRISTLFE